MGPETCQSIADHRDSRHCCSPPHSHWITTGWVVSLLLLVGHTQLVGYAAGLLGSALGARGLGLPRETHRLLGLVMQGKVHMPGEMVMLGHIPKGHFPVLLAVHILVQKLGPLQMHSPSEINMSQAAG